MARKRKPEGCTEFRDGVHRYDREWVCPYGHSLIVVNGR